MNKKGKVLVSVLCMAGMILSMTGCSIGRANSKASNSATEIEISYWNAGLGKEWLDAVIEAFEKENKEYTVTYSASADASATNSAIGMADIDTVDLYMSTKINDFSYLEPLTDVLNAKAYGDSKAIGEKFNESYLQYEKAKDQNIYTLTYGGGIVGFVYNKQMFKDAGITELPRTSNELAYACDKLSSAGYTPLAHYQGNGYYSCIFSAWFSQYDGNDYYLNTFYGNPTLDTLTKKDGRYQALKALEKIVTSDYVLSGSNSSSHTVMQTSFLTDKAAMMVNGSWLSNEMAGTGNMDNFAMMKLPVLSAVVDKLDSVKDEMILRALISAIDDVTDGRKQIEEFQSGDGYTIDGVAISKADWEYVDSIRNMEPSIYTGDSCYIPNYSNAKEGAKEFLKFLYSDKGYKIYAETLHVGMPLNLCEGTLDCSKWNSFEQQQYELLSKAKSHSSYQIMSSHDIFVNGGASADAGFQYIPPLCTKNPADKRNADQIWESIVQNINDKYESDWLANIR